MSHYCTMYPRVSINIQGATRATLRALVPVRSFSSLNYRESHGRPSVEASLSPPPLCPSFALPPPSTVRLFFLSFFLSHGGARRGERSRRRRAANFLFKGKRDYRIPLFSFFEERERKEIGFYKSGLRGMERDGERTLGSRKMHRARG